MSREVFVDSLPKCDLCGVLAKYDGKTTIGPWAYMCKTCFRRFGVGLGTGKGQELILKSRNQELGEAEWLAEVEKLIETEYYPNINDLPDFPFIDWFEGGITPLEAVRKVAELLLEG